MTERYAAFNAWADTQGFGRDYRSDLYPVWEAAFEHKTVTPVVSDKAAHTILVEAMRYMSQWDSSRIKDTSDEQTSGKIIRFIVDAVKDLK